MTVHQRLDFMFTFILCLIWPHRREARGGPGRDSSPDPDRQRPFFRVGPRGLQLKQRDGDVQRHHRFSGGGREAGQRAVTEGGGCPRPLPPPQTTPIPRKLQLQHEVSHTWMQLTGWAPKRGCPGLRLTVYKHYSLYFCLRTSDRETRETLLHFWMPALPQPLCRRMQGTTQKRCRA